MGKPKVISIYDIDKEDVLVCPECGVLFVKTIRGEEWSFWTGTGVYCPVCESLVIKKAEGR